MTRIVMNVQDGSVTETELTVEELAAVATNKLTPEYIAQEAQQVTSQAKLTGILIEGVMCSATDEDQQGMIAIGFGYLKTGAAFKPTKMKFKNGNELVINVDNIAAVEAIWLPFRQSFFTVEV